jgi:hypothetical protein
LNESATSFESDFATFFGFGSINGLVVTKNSTKVTFDGLPRPASCGKFACPLRLQGCGSITSGDGSRLQSAIVWWGGDNQSTSVVLFRSSDGFAWHYVSTIADALHFPWSQEGPNEHDLVLFNYGYIFAVIRLDGGDGPSSHPFSNYYSTLSTDGGETWSAPKEMLGVGSVRPRYALSRTSRGHIR